MFAEKNLRWSALLPALGLQLHAMILSAGIPRVLRLLSRADQDSCARLHGELFLDYFLPRHFQRQKGNGSDF